MDEPLVERARRGDERAFRQLYEKHRHTVARLVIRMAGPGADVEDLVQEVFLQVFRSIGSFRGEARFTTWLYRLTLNVVRMHFRRQRSRPRATEPLPVSLSDTRPSSVPDEAAERAERVRVLYRLLDRLSDKKRTVLVLHDFEGLPAERIAEIVGAPVLTVRTRLFYARKELYQALAEEPALAPIVEQLYEQLPGRPARRRRDRSSAASRKGEEGGVRGDERAERGVEQGPRSRPLRATPVSGGPS